MASSYVARRDFVIGSEPLGPSASLFHATRVYEHGVARVRMWARDDFSHKRRGRSRGVPSSVLNVEA